MGILDAAKGAFIDAAQPLRPSGPVDLGHLARQTLDDREIEAEVLALFVRQARLVREEILRGTMEDRRRLAHTIKGAARGIGAFAVADAADAVEGSPADDRLTGPLVASIGEACDFITALRR